MTGFAQVKGQVADPRTNAPGKNQLGFTLSLKSVNHRFLDVHFRMPSDSDSLEMKLRRLLKEKLARGHVELTLNLDRGGGESFALFPEVHRASGYSASLNSLGSNLRWFATSTISLISIRIIQLPKSPSDVNLFAWRHALR